jgi:hypothetical protein
MDKVLTRTLFKNIYLQSVSRNIARFKDGGLASLKAKHFLIGGEALFTPGEREAMILAPIASSLLTGTRQPGQSQLGAVASNVGAGLPGAVTAALQIGKVEEAARKKPELKAVYNTKTGETEFRTTEEINANRDFLKPAEGFPEQIAKATTAREQASANVKERKDADLRLGAALDVVNLGERLLGHINQPGVKIGGLGDVALAVEGARGAIDQILATDSSSNPYYDENRQTIKNVSDKFFDPSVTSQVRSSTMDLAYTLARAREPGGKFSEADIKRALDTIGKSGSKEVFEAGIKESIYNTITPAIRSYTMAYKDKEGQPLSEEKLRGTPFEKLVDLKGQYSGTTKKETSLSTTGKKGKDPFSPANW